MQKEGVIYMMFFRFPFKPPWQRDGRFFSFGVPLRFVDGREYAYWCDNAARANVLKGRECWGRNRRPILIHAIKVRVQRVLGHVYGLVEAFSYRNATG